MGVPLGTRVVGTGWLLSNGFRQLFKLPGDGPDSLYLAAILSVVMAARMPLPRAAETSFRGQSDG